MGRRLAVEYDGAYRHRDKAELDVDKSRDLLLAGPTVGGRPRNLTRIPPGWPVCRDKATELNADRQEQLRRRFGIGRARRAYHYLRAAALGRVRRVLVLPLEALGDRGNILRGPLSTAV